MAHPYRLRHGGATTDFARKLRSLESIQQRGRWKSQSSLRRYQKGGRLQLLRSATKGRKGRRKTARQVAWPALDPSRPPSVKVFLEIFSGSGRLGRAVGQATGWQVLLWDITLRAEYDLRNVASRRKISEWIRCKWVIAFHLGTPCESFTRARDVPPGPLPCPKAPILHFCIQK